MHPLLGVARRARDVILLPRSAPPRSQAWIPAEALARRRRNRPGAAAAGATATAQAGTSRGDGQGQPQPNAAAGTTDTKAVRHKGSVVSATSDGSGRSHRGIGASPDTVTHIAARAARAGALRRGEQSTSATASGAAGAGAGSAARAAPMAKPGASGPPLPRPPPAAPPAAAPWQPEEMTAEHRKLLYLISRYSSPAGGAHAQELWVSKHALLVLIYEGVVAKVFDYDFAPHSLTIGTRRIFMNVSQEGRDDIDDLLEMGLVFALKLACSEHQSTTAYRINDAGIEALAGVPAAMRAEVVRARGEWVVSGGRRVAAAVDGGRWWWRRRRRRSAYWAREK